MSDGGRVGRTAAPGDPALGPGQSAPVLINTDRSVVTRGTITGTVVVAGSSTPSDTFANPTTALLSWSLGGMWKEASVFGGPDWVRVRAFDTTEGLGQIPEFNLYTFASPFLLDELANAPVGDFFIGRGRLGVAFSRDPGPVGTTPSQGAWDFANPAPALAYRRTLAAAPVHVGAWTPANGAAVGVAGAWFQLWDVDAEGDVPTAAGGARPLASVLVNPGDTGAVASIIPAGGIIATTGLTIAVSAVALWWEDPAALVGDDEAIHNVQLYSPEK